MLARLNLPERPCARLPPATFSGGEQQRVNLARGFSAAVCDCMLIDEPTASLDPANADIALSLIEEAQRARRRHRRHLPRPRRAAAASPTREFLLAPLARGRMSVERRADPRAGGDGPRRIFHGTVVIRGDRIVDGRAGTEQPSACGRSTSRATFCCRAWWTCTPTIWSGT
ncbi:MAG: hypothetical protein RML45_14175 [Acetobacteraceae bacterium]|nr:hypothetical protein [Acetobacteraceae bacterium]